jgi:RNA polymerase sigma factor (sigma-70 family)
VAVSASRWGHMGVIIGEPSLAAPLESLDPGDEDAADTSIEPGPVSFVESDEGLYARLSPELIRFATSLVGPSEAEDLFAAAVIKAISSSAWPRVDNRRAYLYRTLVNEAHKSRRTTSRRLQREIRVVHGDAMEMERGLDPDVLASLKRLSVRQRAVIHLTYWADLTPRQVAETLDTSLRTVERELTSARTRLGEMLS